MSYFELKQFLTPLQNYLCRTLVVASVQSLLNLSRNLRQLRIGAQKFRPERKAEPSRQASPDERHEANVGTSLVFRRSAPPRRQRRRLPRPVCRRAPPRTGHVSALPTPRNTACPCVRGSLRMPLPPCGPPCWRCRTHAGLPHVPAARRARRSRDLFPRPAHRPARASASASPRPSQSGRRSGAQCYVVAFLAASFGNALVAYEISTICRV